MKRRSRYESEADYYRVLPRHSLNTKQAVWTLIVATTLSLLGGLIELSLEARAVRTEVQQQTQQVLGLVSATAAEAAFQLNPTLAEQIVDGLFSAGNLERIELRDDFGRIMAEQQRPQQPPLSPLIYWLFGDLPEFHQPLEYRIDSNSPLESVGELRVQLASDVVGTTFIERSRLIFAVGVFKALGISLFVVLAFSLLITRPLLKIYDAIQQVDPEQPGRWPKPILNSHRKDELGKLVDALDQLLLAFQRGLEQRDRLHQMSTLDGLTGIANRRLFDATLLQAWQTARRSSQPISVLFMDIDNFKPYNDNYGHQAGDDCLRLVAKALVETVTRPADLLARFGGEEFVCVLPNTDKKGALSVAKRMHRAVLELNILHEYSDVEQVITVSVGIATARPGRHDGDPLVLLEEADQRLYRAKALGRNRIVWEDTPLEVEP